jgi:hypothetical protein
MDAFKYSIVGCAAVQTCSTMRANPRGNTLKWQAQACGAIGFPIPIKNLPVISPTFKIDQEPKQIKSVPGVTVPTDLIYAVRFSRARGFGMTIHSSNPTRLPTALEKDAVFHSNAEDLLRVSEFLTLRSDPDQHRSGWAGGGRGPNRRPQQWPSRSGNTFLLPHMGSAPVETRLAVGMAVLDNIDAFCKVGPCHRRCLKILLRRTPWLVAGKALV